MFTLPNQNAFWLRAHKGISSKIIHTLKLPECQGTPCSKEARNLKFEWLQLDSNPRPLSSYTNTQSFSQTGQMIELCCYYIYSHLNFEIWNKILKVKICIFLNLCLAHEAKILYLSLEIMLSPLKWGTKQLCNYKGFSFMPEQVQCFYLLRSQAHECFYGVLSGCKFWYLQCKLHVSDWILNP